MPGSPRFLDLVTVWCLAFEILTRTALEMPAAMLRELEPAPASNPAPKVIGPWHRED
ncbi:hypothetical protein [Methylobacterium sp. Leaf125]|uniref:hypothetical protein n=1 Tax=Methylobacterium sp. Leaf125 TaxID=1736265 RepID=UPI000AFE860A|nr:hypothetical protein [Methylobacterium sp. Leaf125]